MKLLFPLLFCIIAVSTLSYSQDNFSKGYYISGDNEKVDGYIKYQPYYHYRKDFYFKARMDSETVKMTVDDNIKLFYLEDPNQYYKNEIVTIHLKPDFNLEITTDNFYTDTVFVKLLVEGQVSLYVYRDFNMRQSFYLRKDTSEIMELYIKQYYHEILDNGNPVKEIITDDVYSDVLRDNLGDCEVARSEIYKAELTEESLVRLISLYNNCSSVSDGSDYVVKLEPDYKIHINLFSGIGSSRWKFSGTEPVFNEYKSKSNYFPTFGMEISLLFPKVNDKLSFGLGLSVQKNEFINDVEIDKVVFVENQHVELGASIINIPYFLRYSQNYSRTNFHVSAGLFMSYLINPTNKMIINRTFSDGTVVTIEKMAISREKNYEVISAIKTFESGLFLGLGFDYELANEDHLFSEIRAFRGGSLSLTSNVSSEAYTYVLLFGYSF